MELENSKDSMKSDRTLQEEFDDLYQEYRSAVYSFACYLTQNPGEAEDIFQETWLRVVHHLPKKVGVDFAFCPHCGARMEGVCSSCGKKVEEEWKVCPHCGKKLKDA